MVEMISQYKITPLKLRPVNAATRNIKAQFSSSRSKEGRRDHDAKFATFWRRLGFGKPAPEFEWTIEDDFAAILAKQISDEIDREIMSTIMGTK